MDIPSLKKALLNPAIYPDRPGKVELIETHISVLFLTVKHVYKVKKPVDFGFLDFTSIEKRKYFCEREVTLNRRLAPGLYLGVVSITDDQENIALDGQGMVIDYAVKMKRIAEEFLLNQLLFRNRLTLEMIRAVSERLVHFYAAAETSDFIRSFAGPERVKQDTDENFNQTEKYIGISLSGEAYSAIKDRTNKFLTSHEETFYQRMASQKIRDCHGDLRLEHIFWGERIYIIDCIEFNERFRYTDVAADLAFLAMDLDYHGREDLSDELIRTYVDRSRDREVSGVLDFYKGYRAYVRGKVESFRLDDPGLTETKRREVLDRARRYFSLSYRYSLTLAV